MQPSPNQFMAGRKIGQPPYGVQNQYMMPGQMNRFGQGNPPQQGHSANRGHMPQKFAGQMYPGQFNQGMLPPPYQFNQGQAPGPFSPMQQFGHPQQLNPMMGGFPQPAPHSMKPKEKSESTLPKSSPGPMQMNGANMGSDQPSQMQMQEQTQSLMENDVRSLDGEMGAAPERIDDTHCAGMPSDTPKDEQQQNEKTRALFRKLRIEILKFDEALNKVADAIDE